MPQLVYSLKDRDAATIFEQLREGSRSLRGAPAEIAMTPQSVTGRWRTESGEFAAKEFPVKVNPPSFVEYPSEGGIYAGAKVAPTVTFAAARPLLAVALDIAVGGVSVAQIPMETLGTADPLPPPSSHRVGEASARLVIPVFSERFTDEQHFLHAVVGLRGWILSQPPFDDATIGGGLAFDAHFWASDATRGLFGTYDSNIIDGRLFYGDRALARRLLAPWTGPGVSLILIDSTLRGGAGGQPGWSAWTSIAAAPGERWEAIGLHEVGHGLGLADEYLDPQRAGERPARLEPNIASDPRPSKAPWAKRATVGDAPAPTAPLNHAALPKGTIGTFQGARYREDLFRSSETCLMRQTGASFCAACIAHIRGALGS